MNEKWQGKTNTTPVGYPPSGMWFDPSVKEADSNASLADALRHFITTPGTIGLPTHVSESEKRVFFDNGKSLSFDEVVSAFKHTTTEKASGFFDGPVDLGKEHDGDFPSVTWMPRGQEDKDVNDSDLTAARGVPLSVFNAETAPAVLEQIKAGVKAPFVKGSVSTLGGNEHVSIMLTISLDPKESWVNGILENSNYGKFHIDNDGTIEMHSGSLKFRKANANSVVDLVNKINRGITPKSVPPTATPTKTAGQLDPELLRAAIRQYVETNKYDIDWFDKYGENFVEYIRAEALEESNRHLSNNVISRILEEMDADQWYDRYAEDEENHWLDTLEGIVTEEDLAETYPQILESYKKLKPKMEMTFDSSKTASKGDDGQVAKSKAEWKVPLFDGRGVQYFANESDANAYYTKAMSEKKDPSKPVRVAALEKQADDLPFEFKEQIAAKYGVEYISGLEKYTEAFNNHHPKDRAIQYAVSEMKKQDVTIDPTVLSTVVNTYIK